MVCIYCGSPTQVVNSRLQKRANNVWRRRKCVACGAIFTSEEHAALYSSLVVENASKQLVPFSRDQLFASVHDSCRHRPTAVNDATALTQTIIAELTRAQSGGMIAAQDIVAATHTVLQRFDKAAATVYAAYHPHTAS